MTETWCYSEPDEVHIGAKKSEKNTMKIHENRRGIRRTTHYVYVIFFEDYSVILNFSFLSFKKFYQCTYMFGIVPTVYVFVLVWMIYCCEISRFMAQAKQ